MKNNNPSAVSAVLVIVALVLFFSFTNPNDIGLEYLLIPFILLGYLIFILVRSMIGFIFTNYSNKSKIDAYSFIATLIFMNILLLK